MPAEPIDSLEFIVELYQIATLIYLLRASQSVWEAPANLESMLDRVFAVAHPGPGCGHFFPLFIVACEARKDEQRAAILELIEKNQRRSHKRSMTGLRAEIQSIWVQQDLHEDGEQVMNYLRVMNAVISSNLTLPSYV